MKRRSGLRFILATCLILALGLGAAILQAGGVRELLRMDPPGMDYTWLRSGLAQAEDAADVSLDHARRAGARAAAATLQRAIRHSRANARRGDTQPIPPHLRKELEDFFPAHILDDVRWTFPSRGLDLGSAVAAWYRSHGGAVTLEDTIVYSNQRAVSLRYLWAHELTHVMQFEELGLAGFARVYVTNPQFLERQAWANARQVVFALQRREREAAAAALAGVEPPPARPQNAWVTPNLAVNPKGLAVNGS